MNKKIVLTSVLGILLVVLVVVYVFGFKSKNTTTLNTSTQGQDKKLLDLNKELKEYELFFTLPKHSNLNIEQNVDLSDDVDELRAQVMELRAKNKLLYDDNLELVGKNYEIAIALDNEKTKTKEIKHQLQAKSLESINESEKQHYQNINELTRRINELQKENLNTIKEYEQKLVGLENKIDELQTNLRDKDLITNDEVAKATKNERIKNSSLAEKNLYLIDEINKLKQSTSMHTQKLLEDISNKKTENDKLKKIILEKESLINQILAKHTAELMEFDKKTQSQIKKLKSENISLKNDNDSEIENIKIKHEKEISKLNEQIKKLLNDKGAAGDDTQTLLLEKKDEQIALLQMQLAKQKADKPRQIQAVLSDKDKQNYKILNDKIILLERKNKELNKIKDEINTSSNTIKHLELEQTKLEEQNAFLQEKLKEANVKISSFVSKDYELVIAKQDEKLKSYQIDNETLKTSLKETENRLASIQKQLEHSMNENQTQDYENKNNFRKLEKQLESKTEEINKIQNINKTLVKENASLKVKASGIENFELANNKLKQQLSSAKSQLEEKEQKIVILTKLNDEFKVKLNDKSNQLNVENAELSKQLNDTKKQVINLTAIKEENENVIEELKLNNQKLLKAQNELLNQKKQEQTQLNVTFKKDLERLNKTNIDLVSKINLLSEENKELKSSNAKLQETIEKNTNDFNIKVDDFNSKITMLTGEKTKLKKQNEILQEQNNAIKESKNEKAPQNDENQNNKNQKIDLTSLKLAQSVVCDDLKSGQKNLTNSCKSKIEKVLKNVANHAIYEIEPIVDDGGFSTLNNFKKQGLISQSEFDRLTLFANFGLGRDRGEKASEYIKSIKKDANVYLSRDLMIEPNKRGFILKIYQ